MLFLFFFLVLSFTGVCAAPADVFLTIQSEVKLPLYIFWIGDQGNLVSQRSKPLTESHTMNIKSYSGHSFLLTSDEKATHFDPTTNTDPKSSLVFKMSQYDATITIIYEGDEKLGYKYSDAYAELGEAVIKSREKCSTNNGEYMSDRAVECFKETLAATVMPKDREIKRMRRTMDAVSDRLRNYTCADPNMTNTDPPLRTFNYENSLVSVFLEETDSSIMLVDNFISEKECDALMERGRDGLAPAAVSGENNELLFSTARRAKANTVYPDLSKEPGTDIITDLFRRGYKFANDQTGYNLNLDGQEGFNLIKYDPTDEYLPHCDGSCIGDSHKKAGRVCTIVFYCGAAEVGGGTSFSSVDVFLKGKKGQAAFFSYYDKETKKMDAGNTRHSGCPIFKGEKWIATLWMRIGVSADEPWSLFDPKGSKKEEREGEREEAHKAGGEEL